MKDNHLTILQTILTIILPPVGVFMEEGFGIHFWINILLTLLGYVPGLIHGLYILFTSRS